MPQAVTNMAVFLDRDGVLNEAVVRHGRPYPPASASEMRIAPGARQACISLRLLGFKLLVVTNQPDVARGTLDRATLDGIHARLIAELPLDGIYVCPHDDSDGCTCRKPAPGLILTAAADYAVDMTRSFMVGDRWKDIEAGVRAGCRTILVQRNYRESEPCGADAEVADLAKAAQWIANQVRPDEENADDRSQ